MTRATPQIHGPSLLQSLRGTNPSAASCSGLRVSCGCSAVVVLLALEVACSFIVLVGTAVDDAFVPLELASVCGVDSILESVDAELSSDVVDIVDNVYTGVSDVAVSEEVDDGADLDVVDGGTIVTAIDVSLLVVDGAAIGSGWIVVKVGCDDAFLHRALTKFPLCASDINEFGCTSTESQEALMFACTRSRARSHACEHCPPLKSPISHPIMGVLYAKMQLSGTENDVIISTTERVSSVPSALASKSANAPIHILACRIVPD